jgi:hypothetical protein
MNSYDNSLQPVGKKKGLSALIPVMAVILVIAVVACIVAAVVGRNPAVKVGRAIKASIRAAEANETVDTVVSTLETGSVGIEGDLKALTSSLVGLEIDAGVRFKAYFNTKNRSETAAEAAVMMSGNDLADVSFYSDGKSAALSSEALFGKKSYGFKFADVEKKFDDSIFGPDGAYSIGIDGEELSRILDTVSGLEDSKGETKKLAEDTVKDILAMAVKHAKTKTENGSVSTGSTEVKTSDVTMTLAEEDLRDFVLDAVDYLRKNKELRGFLEKTFDEDSGLPYVDFNVENFYDELDDMYESVKDTDKEDLEDVSLTVTFRISKSNGQLIGLDLITEDDGGGISVSAVAAPDWKSPAYIRFKYDDGFEPVDVRYTAEDEKDGYSGKLTVKSDGKDVLSGSVNWDKGDGDFTLKASSYSWWSESMEEVFSLKGNLDKNGGTSVYTLKSLEVEGNSVRLNGIVLTVKESDKMPVIKGYTDLLTMSEDEMQDLVSDVEDFSERFMSEITGSLGFLADLFY